MGEKWGHPQKKWAGESGTPESESGTPTYYEGFQIGSSSNFQRLSNIFC